MKLINGDPSIKHSIYKNISKEFTKEIKSSKIFIIFLLNIIINSINTILFLCCQLLHWLKSFILHRIFKVILAFLLVNFGIFLHNSLVVILWVIWVRSYYIPAARWSSSKSKDFEFHQNLSYSFLLKWRFMRLYHLFNAFLTTRLAKKCWLLIRWKIAWIFQIDIVTWSTTKRREIWDFPYPSVFELTGHQRLTVKGRIRTVGQFLAAKVTNPGQNESQQMFAFCDRMDKEVGIGTYSSPNESLDRVKEGMIGQNPKNGSSTLFVSGNRK